MVGRADLRLRFSSRIYSSLFTHFGQMSVHSGLMMLMAMLMIAMLMVLVMVIVVPEALRHVGWVCQH